MGKTTVHRGVKLDNLVQIAHNVEVGSHTVMSSQVGVAGSAKVGEWCMFGGQVGIAGHITIGDHTNVGAQAGVPGGNLASRGGATLMGYPAIEHRQWARQSAALKMLPDLVKEVSELKKEIEELKK
jgi:UDP-3-O-[3-hydroxymyristoyl] glucosamine N-acyltransferase